MNDLKDLFKLMNTDKELNVTAERFFKKVESYESKIDLSKPITDMINSCKGYTDILNAGICLKITLSGVKAQIALDKAMLFDILMAARENFTNELKSDIKKALQHFYNEIEEAIDEEAKK